MSLITKAPQIAFPELKEGEVYAGILLGKNGAPNHHVILLPGDMDDGKWSDAKTFAASIGGVLPTRREQSLLFANCGEEFKNDWYWSGEEHEKESGWAWYQHFTNGSQGLTRKHNELRARAVRRLSI